MSVSDWLSTAALTISVLAVADGLLYALRWDEPVVTVKGQQSIYATSKDPRRAAREFHHRGLQHWKSSDSSAESVMAV